LIGPALGAIITPHGMEDRSRGLVPCFHLLTATGDGERILPTAIIERFCMGADVSWSRWRRAPRVRSR